MTHAENGIESEIGLGTSNIFLNEPTKGKIRVMSMDIIAYHINT